MQHPTCPHCNAPLPDARGITFHDAVLSYNNTSVRLATGEVPGFALLLRRIGRTVRRACIYDSLCLPTRDYPDPKSTDVIIYKIRRRIAPLGLTITTDWGIGYRLEIPGTQPQPARVATPFVRLNGSVSAS